MKVGRVKVVVLNVILLVMLVVSVNGSVWNSLNCQALPVSCETPKVILQSGTAGASTIYTNNTSAKVSVVAPAPVPTYYPTGYNVLSGNWWNLNYDYRRQISITNNAASTLSSGHSVCLTVNTTSLVSDGKMLSTGDDLRILYWNGSSSAWLELDRHVIDMNTSSTQVWLKTQASIGASSSDGNYYMYYGCSGAVNPPLNFSRGAIALVVANPSNPNPGDDVRVHERLQNSLFSVTYFSHTDQSWTPADYDAVLASQSCSSPNLAWLCDKEVGMLTWEQSIEEWKIVSGGSTWSGTQIEITDNSHYITKNENIGNLTVLTSSTSGYYYDGWDGHGIDDLATVPGQPARAVIVEIDKGENRTDDTLSPERRGGWVIASESDWGPANNKFWELFDRAVDWVAHLDMESSTQLGSEETSYYMSGTVPRSVETVDSDYLIIKSAGNRWWDQNYNYRKQITITNNAAFVLSSDYSVCVTMDTASLVSAGKMLSNGSDLRIVYWNGTSLVELDRHIIDMNTTSTQVWFKTQANILASSSDNNYYIYYGNPSAINPPAYWSDSMGADPSSKVYMAADDFQEHNSGEAPDGWAPCDGYFKVGASGSNKFMNSTANGRYLFAGGSAWTDYVVKVKMQAPTGSVSYPGIDVRATDVNNTVYYGWRNATTLTLWKCIGGIYTELGSWAIPNVGTAWHTIEIRVKGQDLYVYHDETYYGSAILNAGELTSGKVGIFSSYGTHAHWDDYTVRKYVSPEPSTSLGSETNPKHEVSTEFVFSGITKNTPTQLNFTVVSEYDTSSVSVTIQVWNYSSSAYVTSGEGYLTYTSAGANETKLLSIDTNPQFYTSAGNGKIKVTGVKSTTTQYQQKTNQIKLDYKYVETTPTYYPNGYNIITGTYFSGTLPDSVQAVDSDYFILNSTSYSSPPWYDNKYDYRTQVTVTEPNKLARTYEPVEVYVTFTQGRCYSKDTIRVAYWNGSTWIEIPSQVYNVTLWADNTVKSATVLWLVDIGLNASKDYYIYYDKDGEVSAPSYTGLSTPSVVNRGTTFNLTTAYGTGDTIKIKCTYYGVERNVTWINLKQNGIVAWSDWYMAPGIFHLWINGSDVFEGGALTGEANTGLICEHSDGSSYVYKGNANSVTFEVVGPLLIKIKIVYASVGSLTCTYTDIFSIYYTPDFLTTRIKMDHKQEVTTSFTEATWGDWAHLDFPAWDITPTQTNLAYRTSAGTYTEALTPNATGGTQHSDWTERWIEIFDNATVEPALGLFFMADDRHTINTANYRIMNVGGSGSIWGIHWFPYWSVGSTVSGTYNYQFQWVAKKTNETAPIRNEYIKAVNPVSTSVSAETSLLPEVSNEFLFSGMTTNATSQLKFQVVSQYDIANVSVTIQVYNYSSSSYVTSGEGYLSYTSSSTANTDKTKVLCITTNPQFYTSAGSVKTKLTAVKNTALQFQQKTNLLKLDYKFEAVTYDYVLEILNQVTDSWKVNLKVYDSSNIGRLSNATISLHDGTTSDQIIVSGGVITQSEGPPYNLTASTTIYISISDLQATSSGTSYLYVYLKILVPEFSTYNLFVITFEIT